MTTRAAGYRLPRPATRLGFEIAIICALVLEADAVEALFDFHWDEHDPPFDKAPGDPNAYSTGAIGRHNVVLAHMPGMGSTNAAVVASNCRISFPNIKLALVVGVCGVIPFGPGGEEIILGDVVISDGVILYDLGHQLPDRFVRKDTLLDSLGRPNLEIRALLAKLKTLRGRKQLGTSIATYLGALQDELLLAADYPGAIYDRLFEATYRHVGDTESCEQAGCDGNLLLRRRLQAGRAEHQPAIHFGLMASGNLVMKSGEDRDAIAAREGVIAFEMEGAGVWDTFPCVVIKGACDYADSHKSKSWQRYAAATAAACTKAFLSHWMPSPPADSQQASAGSRLPVRNRFFSGRDAEIVQLEDYFTPSPSRHGTKVVVLEGMGGIGKTQLALEYGHRRYQSGQKVYWISAMSASTLKEEFLDAGKNAFPHLSALTIDIVRRTFEGTSNWLMIIDNADDRGIDISQYIPEATFGQVIVTSRDLELCRHLQGQSFPVLLPSIDEARLLWELRFSPPHSPPDTRTLKDDYPDCVDWLLSTVENLPLAITLAAAYLAKHTDIGIAEYLECYASQQASPELLRFGHHFSPASVMSTFEVSFNRLLSEDPRAAALLQILGFLHPHGVAEHIVASAFVNMPQRFGRFDVAIAPPDFLLEQLSLNKAETPEASRIRSVQYRQAVANLKSISLLTQDDDSNILLAGPRFRRLRLHPVIHQWIRARLNAEKREHANPLICASLVLLHYLPLTLATGERLLEEHLRTHAADAYSHILVLSDDIQAFNGELSDVPIETTCLLAIANLATHRARLDARQKAGERGYSEDGEGAKLSTSLSIAVSSVTPSMLPIASLLERMSLLSSLVPATYEEWKKPASSATLTEMIREISIAATLTTGEDSLARAPHVLAVLSFLAYAIGAIHFVLPAGIVPEDWQSQLLAKVKRLCLARSDICGQYLTTLMDTALSFNMLQRGLEAGTNRSGFIFDKESAEVVYQTLQIHLKLMADLVAVWVPGDIIVLDIVGYSSQASGNEVFPKTSFKIHDSFRDFVKSYFNLFLHSLMIRNDIDDLRKALMVLLQRCPALLFQHDKVVKLLNRISPTLTCADVDGQLLARAMIIMGDPAMIKLGRCSPGIPSPLFGWVTAAVNLTYIQYQKGEYVAASLLGYGVLQAFRFLSPSDVEKSSNFVDVIRSVANTVEHSLRRLGHYVEEDEILIRVAERTVLCSSQVRTATRELMETEKTEKHVWGILSGEDNSSSEANDTWLFLTSSDEQLEKIAGRRFKKPEMDNLWGAESDLYCKQCGQCAADFALFMPPLFEDPAAVRYPVNTGSDGPQQLSTTRFTGPCVSNLVETGLGQPAQPYRGGTWSRGFSMRRSVERFCSSRKRVRVMADENTAEETRDPSTRFGEFVHQNVWSGSRGGRGGGFSGSRGTGRRAFPRVSFLDNLNYAVTFVDPPAWNNRDEDTSGGSDDWELADGNESGSGGSESGYELGG
ncbi:hypothetical protein FOVSG1_006449 [Fusarium oxysporum f. sp. vasinfectum]